MHFDLRLHLDAELYKLQRYMNALIFTVFHLGTDFELINKLFGGSVERIVSQLGIKGIIARDVAVILFKESRKSREQEAMEN